MKVIDFEKVREAQRRANAKRIEKLNSDEYKQKQLAKQQANYQRHIARINSFEYKEQQRAKQIEAQQRRAAKPLKKTKSKVGLKGKSRTSSDISLHDLLSQLGCICCINLGLTQPFDGSFVSIHHVDGRTKPHSHKKALPLCECHHNTPISSTSPLFALYPQIFPIHAVGSIGGKKRWEEVNGTQVDLMQQVAEYFESLIYTDNGLEFVK